MSPEFLISNSKVAAVVSDPRQPDNPIIACNQAFVQLTGYERGEIIGRNCRFLRGAETEPEQTESLREAVRECRPAMVELTNYRKDGSAFRNAVMIAPLFDDEGELAYFLGSQIAIDENEASRRQLAHSRIEGLTYRQRQIIALLAKGQLNKQIAYELGVTERTIKMHRAALLTSLEVRTIAEAIRIAVEAGL
jgi:PAS domain S-box-containing protein